MNLVESEFKRKFSFSMVKNLKLKLGEMTFSKDFINDNRGDLYPILEKSEDCLERLENCCYIVEKGYLKRLICQFFPFATYELTTEPAEGTVGFCFQMPIAEATVSLARDKLIYSCGEHREEADLPDFINGECTMLVSCRPGAFDVYFNHNGLAEFCCTFQEEQFENSNQYAAFSNGYVQLAASGHIVVKEAVSYIDNGISIADIRPIRYENSEVLMEQGKIYLTASIRQQEGGFQGVFSWIPGTAEFDLTGALFYDSGDGTWCGDVAASVLYHRAEKQWYLWVCAFSHGHILGYSFFAGDPRFGVNAVDINLMEKAPENADISAFKGFRGDEDPDFFFDEEKQKWLMAICRKNPSTKQYTYVFFESEHPFEGYRYLGKGPDGCETGGSFVKIQGELVFVCGNDFHKTSDYRIYSKDGMKNAAFRYPDGGFRGWGTVIPVQLGSRTRYFWLTFDRHNGSGYTWSYGNLYCFEA